VCAEGCGLGGLFDVVCGVIVVHISVGQQLGKNIIIVCQLVRLECLLYMLCVTLLCHQGNDATIIGALFALGLVIGVLILHIINEEVIHIVSVIIALIIIVRT
jgi:hypothetical protein